MNNTDQLRRGYAAFSSGDLDTLTEVIAADCQWIVGGDNALTGTYSGRDAVFDYFAKLLGSTDGTFTVELLQAHEVMPDTVLVLARAAATAHGSSFDEQLWQQVQLLDGKVVSCRTYVENGHLWDQVIGPRSITLPSQERAGVTTA